MNLLDALSPFWTTFAFLSMVMLILGIVTLPWMLALIPYDYFLKHDDYLSNWKQTRPLFRLVVLSLRNLLGTILLLMGIIMLVTPGQGLVTILLGLACMTFPGKRRLELQILRQRGVARTINWLRAKMNRPPLQLPDGQSSD